MHHDDEENEFFNIDLSVENVGDIQDKESDIIQKENLDAFCALAQSSQYLLSGSKPFQVVNNLNPALSVSREPSRHLVRTQPTLTFLTPLDLQFKNLKDH